MVKKEIINYLIEKDSPVYYETLFKKIETKFPKINQKKMSKSLNSLIERDKIIELGTDGYMLK